MQKNKLKKSVSLVVEYTLLTFVVLVLIITSFSLVENSIKKYEEYRKEKYFMDFCPEFLFFLDNMNEKALYYLPYELNFEGNKVYYKDTLICKSNKYEFCKTNIKGKILIEKNKNFICFKKISQ